jgi:Ca-activated chloride channel family protein
VSAHRALLTLFATALAASAQAGTWTNLWSTPDQQGQRALEAGHPGEAAKLFQDPRRQAFAEVQAKDYDTAEKRLARFDDGQSEYNRGNALAKSGKLQPALDAYDAALKHGDLDAALRRDAQHNRDLVAAQLKPPEQQKDGGQQNQQQGGQPQDPKHPQDSNQSQDTKQSQDSKQPQSAQNNGSQSAQPPPSADAGQQSQGKQGSDAASEEQKAQRDAAQALKESQGAGQQQPSAANADERRQANANGQSSRDSGSSKDRGQADTMPRPPTEQSLALDQWLRQIPDDPGGLLRRKFLIEHMLKQNGDVP